jgi:hypothetical protein
MTFTLFIGLKQIEAFFPRCLTRIPDEPKLIESSLAVDGHPHFSATLTNDPLAQWEAILNMSGRDATMTLAFPVAREMPDRFFPSRLK